MKKLIVLLLITIPFLANSQSNVQWGLKVGLQFTQLRGDVFRGYVGGNGNSIPEEISSKGSGSLGYTLGGFVRTTEDFFLQGELLIATKGGQLTRNSTNKQLVQFGQIDIPLSVGYRVGTLEFLGGPVISVQAYDDGNLKEFLSAYSSSPLTFSPYRPYNVGYHLGAGMNFGKLSLNLRYLASIQNVSGINIFYTVDGQRKNSRFEQYSSAVQVSVGYQIK
jgi:Outer membrane protein beta-barrel domain